MTTGSSRLPVHKYFRRPLPIVPIKGQSSQSHSSWPAGRRHPITMASAACAAVESAYPASISDVPVLQVVMGCIGFCSFLLLNSATQVRWLPTGRMGSSLVSAAIMSVFVIPPDLIYGALGCSFRLPLVLFGMLLVSHHLKGAGLLEVLETAITIRAAGAFDMLGRVAAVGMLSAALLMWDSASILLSPLILKIVKERNLPWEPFLLCLMCSLNMGSAWTPVGSPVNVVAVGISGISFGRYMMYTTAPVILALLLCVGYISLIYWRPLRSWEADKAAGAVQDESLHHKIPDRTPQDRGSDIEASVSSMIPVADVGEDATINPLPDSLSDGNGPTLHSRAMFARAWSFFRTRVLPYVALLASFALWFLGFDMGVVALVAGVACMVAVGWGYAGPMLQEAEDYVLLTYILALIVTVIAFNLTGVPASFLNALSPYMGLATAQGVAILVLVLVILVNFVTSVPTIFIVAAPLSTVIIEEGLHQQEAALVFIPFMICLAANAFVNGSCTNVICIEIFRGGGLHLSVLQHTKVGSVVTAITLSATAPLLLFLLSL